MLPQRTAGSVLDYGPMPTAFGFGVVAMTSGSASGMFIWENSEPVSGLIGDVVSNRLVYSPGSEVLASTAITVHAVGNFEDMVFGTQVIELKLSRAGSPTNYEQMYEQMKIFLAAYSMRLAYRLPSLSAAQSLLRSYAHFKFEDGMEDDFTPHLAKLIRNHTTETVEAIRREIADGRLEPEFVWRILRRLGAIDDPPSRIARLSLLQECLAHTSRWIRDGAGLGLAFLGDRSAIASLERAIDRETIPGLKDDLSKALQHLAAETR